MPKELNAPDAATPPAHTRAPRAGDAPARGASLVPAALALAALLLACLPAAAQGGQHVLYGDVKVDESKAAGKAPLSYDLILYVEGGAGIAVARQSVPNNGRYRFNDLPNGNYDLVVEVEGAEVARVRVRVFSNFKNDFRQDILLEWRDRTPGAGKSGVAATADFYKRPPASQKLFDRAASAMTARKYADAAALLEQAVGADAQDYQAWTELGTAYLFQEKAAEAERSYLRAVEVKPSFVLAYVNLGRLRIAQKNYDGAIEILTKAVALQPPSADANFLLGESYLQIKKGSQAVPHLEEAARLGRADAHLRLATLYNAVGMKDRAAAEYERFLSKKPDSPERKKLEQYIKENKKQ
jgi:tetratricopeptide (TPR) repeat protein